MNEGEAAVVGEHYMLLNDSMEPHAERFVPGAGDWQVRVLSDLVRDRKLHLVTMAPTSQGTRIGLAGERSFCEAAVDKGRPDTLFIYRIEAARPAGSHVPRTYAADFRLFSRGSYNPRLDPLEPPFPISPERLAASAGWRKRAPDPGTARAIAPPTPGLAETLAAAGADVRSALRPISGLPPLGDAEFVERARTLGRTYRLERFVRGRAASYISGMISRAELGEDRSLVQGVFSTALVEAFLRSSGAGDIHRFLMDLGGFDLLPTVRIALWGGTLYRLEAAQLIEEIREAGEALLAIQAVEGELAVRLVLDVVTSVAQKTGDPTLTAVADRAISLDDLMASVASLATQMAPHEARDAGRKVSSVPPRADELVSPQILIAKTGVLEPVEPQTFPSATLAAQHAREETPVIELDTAPTVGTSPVSAVAPPPPNVEMSESSPDARVRSWVLRYRQLPSRAKTVRAGLQPLLNRLDELTDRSLSFDDAKSFQELLLSIRGSAETYARDWPSRATLDADAEDMRSSLELVRESLGDSALSLLAGEVTPDDLLEIGDLWKASRGFVDFPAWLLTTDGKSTGAGSVTPLALLDATLRARLRPITDELGRSNLEDWAFLRDLEPAVLADPVEHVKAAISRQADSVERVQAAPPEYRMLLQSLVKAGRVPQNVPIVVSRLNRLRDQIAPETFSSLLQRLAADPLEAPLGVMLGAYEASVVRLEAITGSAHDATWRQIEATAQKEIQTNSKQPSIESFGLRLSHNYVDEQATRVPLVLRRHGDLPYYQLAVPVVLSAARPISARLQLSVETDLRAGWPGQWPGPSPAEINLVESSFRQDTSSEARDGRVVYTFKLVVPVKLPQGRGRAPAEAVSVKVNLVDGASGQVVATRELKWDSHETSEKPLYFNLPDATNPNYVDAHPTGPQNHVATIRSRIRNRSSFAIVAPRRFGKTTLVEYLRQDQGDGSVHVGPVVLCTTYHDARGLDYEGMWRFVSSELQQQLGSAMDLALVDNLPRPAAFDHVRRAVRQNGKSSLLLLFDEAQLFFPRRRGSELGDRLKDLLERTWSRSDDPELAPVLFGFVGLPSLPERAGANLCGVLRPILHTEIQENDLNRIILAATEQGLHTTREARMGLARASRNLGVLRTLLEQLITVAREDLRNWISHDDVETVQRSLHTDLREGRAVHGLAQWLRDAVNDAETINEWRPSPCFPVAIALAQTRRTGRDRSQIVSAVESVLNSWASGLSTDKTLSAIYTSDRIDDHLRTLVERGVIEKDLTFTTEMFEAWLLGESRSGYPEEEAAQKALLEGAVMHIAVPAGAEEMGAGAQAKVYRFQDDERFYALRRYRLNSKEDRQRFVDTVETLNLLRKSRYLSEDGGDYVFELRNIGLNADDPMEAVQIYRWIDGESLEGRVGALSAEVVVDLGIKLATGLQLLHKYGIVHRDLRPANIILARDGARPVLIDFGLARIIAGESNTSIGSEYAAPEVRGTRPHWSKAADVFSFGVTLSRLLQKGRRAPMLEPLLAKLVSERQEERPPVEGVLEQLKDIAQSLHLEGIKEDHWREISTAVKADEHKAWYRRVVDKFRPQFIGMRMGLHPSAQAKEGDFADFLNQVVEALPRPRQERQTLGAIAAKGFGAIPADDPSIRVLQRLRNQRDHVARSHPGASGQRTSLRPGCELLAKELSLSSLIALGEALGVLDGPP